MSCVKKKSMWFSAGCDTNCECTVAEDSSKLEFKRRGSMLSVKLKQRG